MPIGVLKTAKVADSHFCLVLKFYMMTNKSGFRFGQKEAAMEKTQGESFALWVLLMLLLMIPVVLELTQ